MRTSFWMRLSQLLLVTAPLTVQAMDNTATIPITIYADFTGSYSRQARSALERQLAAIMAPAGLEFVWRDLKSAKSGDVVGRLVIASFKGDCAIDPAPQGRLDDAPLGWTDVSDEAVLPFISISCDRVQTLIHPLSRGMPLGRQEEVFGGALARVMAHELYHFLAGTIRHSSQGVAKPYFTANDLVSPDFNFEAKENTAMWRSRARASAATATASEAIAGRAK